MKKYIISFLILLAFFLPFYGANAVEALSENTISACTNEFDDDSDGQVDSEDPDCAYLYQETSIATCTDSFDNDSDGQVDSEDPDCAFLYQENSESTCYDSFDNDSDGQVDSEDPDCAPFYPTNFAPVITLTGTSMEIVKGSPFVEPGYSASDTEDGDITEAVIVTGTIDINTPGTYTLTYTVTDSNENTVSVTRDIVVVESTPEVIEKTSSAPSSGSRRRSVGGEVLGTSTGEVLGVSTDLSCGIYLNKWIKSGWENEPLEVLKLQIFLVSKGFNSPINGVYDSATVEAVNQFQLAHREYVLKPWVELGFGDGNTPTGFVYVTTLWMINEIVCPGIAPFPTIK